MHWSDWVLVVWLAIGAIASVAVVGQPRKPLEPGSAVLSILITGALISMMFATHN